MTAPLNQQHILITRPKHQASGLQTRITELGGAVQLLPTIHIIPAGKQSKILEAIEQLNSCDIAIFVSANAAHYLLPRWPNPDLPIAIFAIGPATAAAVESYGLSVTAMPDNYHSEGLLALPELQKIRRKHITIFCGEDTRGLLKKSLAERGAIITETPCYRREKAQIDLAQALPSDIFNTITTMVSTSQESLTHLLALLDQAGYAWQSKTLVVISAAMAEFAREQGATHVVIADNATDDAVVAALG